MSHRRWSILSNTFNQQQPMMNVGGTANSGSIHSINDLHPNIMRKIVRNIRVSLSWVNIFYFLNCSWTPSQLFYSWRGIFSARVARCNRRSIRDLEYCRTICHRCATYGKRETKSSIGSGTSTFAKEEFSIIVTNSASTADEFKWTKEGFV